MSITSFPRGVLVGATLMYFFDPARGRRRRARIAELAAHARRVERQLVGKAMRDAQHRARGAAERIVQPIRGAASSDEIVRERVRAAIGRAVSHARAIEVAVEDGRVVLRGPILGREADAAVGSADATPGVREVIDRLERHANADVPALQGEGRAIGRRTTWTPAARLVAMGTGAAIAAYGLLRGGLLGVAAGAAGGVLAVRGATGRALRGDDGVIVQKTITVNVPIDRVFGLWAHLENFPRFLEHVRAIDVDGDRSHWSVEGPAGRTIEFDAETTHVDENREISWRTLPDHPIEHSGSVRFERAGDAATRIHVLMTYRPLGGQLGHAIAHVLGWDPKARMDDDLVRMKGLLEVGFTRAHGQRTRLDELH